MIGLGKDVYNSKLARGIATGTGLTYLPINISSLSDNISEGNYGDAALDVGAIGLNLLPGFKFGNFGSTLSTPVKWLAKGWGQEFNKAYNAGKNLKNFTYL